MKAIAALFLAALYLGAGAVLADDAAKPPGKTVIAIFPLLGDAPESLRDRAGQALRLKLDRTGKYEVIDGITMRDIAEAADGPIGFAAKLPDLRAAMKGFDCDLLLWGEVRSLGPSSVELRVRIAHMQQKVDRPAEVVKRIDDPQSLRFAVEQILETLPAVDSFRRVREHDEAIVDDEQAKRLWADGPNLVANGDFSAAGKWEGIFRAEKYPLPLSNDKPAADKMVIWPMPVDGAVNRVLLMNMSDDAAATNGLSCRSDAIAIEPNTRYRLSFRYNSRGPVLHVFVKGYTLFEDINGQKVPREIYRRQVPVTGGTGGQWQTVVDELNPQHVAYPVQQLRIDFYVYLKAGEVMFDDVVLKAVGPIAHRARDGAITRPTSRPAR